MVYNVTVALQRLVVHAAHGNRTFASYTRHNPKGSRRPVTLNNHALRHAVLLSTLYPVHVATLLHLNAGYAQCIERHCNIRGTCEPVGNLNLAILGRQGQGKEQACEVLRRYVARQAVLAATQGSVAGQWQLIGSVACKGNPVRCKGIEQSTHGTLWQLACAHKCSIGTKHSCNRHKETQSGTALAAVKCSTLYHIYRGYIKNAR